jgi:DNA-binding XRE family transcriptional regulator
MKKLKQGWVQGSVQDFLKLSDADMEYIEAKRAWSAKLRDFRRRRHLTQAAVAARLSTSQPRVAMMEKGDPSVSLDLLARSLLALGATRRDLARAL